MAAAAIAPQVRAPLRLLPVVGFTLLIASGCTAEVTGLLPGGTPGSGGTSAGGASAVAGAGGSGSTVVLGSGGVKLRRLTRAEYKSSIQALFGPLTTPLEVTADTSVAGFITVGASQVTVGELAAESYEATSRAVVAEVFADAQRWAGLVGCQPPADLSDGCVVDYLRKLGRRAFRRALSEEEVMQWATVARGAAVLAKDPVVGLATATSGILQSPHFLYRAETTKPDVLKGRLKFDGASMATRLSFLLRGTTPSDTLLDSAASGALDTADGLRAAAAQLLAEPDSVAYMAEFFTELSGLGQVLDVEKDQVKFASLDAGLRASMLEESRRWVSDVVLAPQADVRSLFDSNRTFVDARLAELYGVPAPASGFAEVTLAPESGRAGILGKAGFLTVHSAPSSSSPTKRGYFILSRFLCQTPPPPPPGVDTMIDEDPNTGPQTTRQRFERHRADAKCASCHALMDPYGFSLEHFDAMGRYRDTDNGLPIDSSGELGGMPFNGLVQLSALLRQDSRTNACMVRNFYRHANGRIDDETDLALIETLAATLASKNHVWRELLLDFVTSDAFVSAPPPTAVAPAP